MKRSASAMSESGGAAAAAADAAAAAAATETTVRLDRRRGREWQDDDDDQGQPVAARYRAAPAPIASTFHHRTFEDEHLAHHVDQLYQLGLLDRDRPLPRTWRALCGAEHMLRTDDAKEATAYDPDTTIAFADPISGLAMAPADAVRLGDQCYSRASARAAVQDAYERGLALDISDEELRLLQLDPDHFVDPVSV